ncbi:MAG: hypothetical protein AB2693_29975 [Candidatus Thiodiazotropha sp.]
MLTIEAEVPGRVTGPFDQRPHFEAREVEAAFHLKDGIRLDHPEVGHYSPSLNQGQGHFSPSLSERRENSISLFSVSPVTVGEIAVSVHPGRDLSENLVHDAVKNLGLTPSNIDYPVGGRLQYFLSNWKRLTQDSFILQLVQGLEIPFLETPTQTSFHPQMPNQAEAALIDHEVQEMIAKKAIKEVSTCSGQFLSPVFLVAKKDGGQRPVINLKKLNQFVEYQHFKMEGIQSLKPLIQKGDYMVKLDLSDAYFGVQ